MEMALNEPSSDTSPLLAAQTAGTNSANRIEALDGLRGIAALIVVFHHASMVFSYRSYFEHFGLKLLVAGHGAVIVFFALSGFVLTATCLGKDRAYWPYAIKRVVCIYVPFAAAVLLAAGLSAAIGHEPVAGASFWFNVQGWHSPVTADLLWAHLSMGSANELDNVIWSLFHEMRISLVIPLLAVLMLKRPRAVLILTLVLAAIGAFAASRWSADRYLSDCLTSLQYLPLFAAGGAIAIYRHHIVDPLAALPRWARALLILAALAALTVGLASGPVSSLIMLLKMVISDLGALVLIAVVLGGGWLARRVLVHPVALYLGWVSYSLYLTHLLVLEVVVRETQGRLSHGLQLALFFVLAMPIAHLFRMTFEKLGQALGRLMARAFSGRAATAAPGLGSGVAL